MLFDVGVSGRTSYSIVGYLLAHLSRRLIGEALSIYRHPTFVRPSSVRQHLIGCQGNINGLLLKNHKQVKVKLCIHVQGIATSLVVLFIAVLLQIF